MIWESGYISHLRFHEGTPLEHQFPHADILQARVNELNSPAAFKLLKMENALHVTGVAVGKKSETDSKLKGT